jgi:hypothetical protein
VNGARVVGLPLVLGRHALELAARALAAWLRWFWSLSVRGKVVLTAVEIVVLDLVTFSLPLAPAVQHGVIDGGAICLVLLCSLGVLAGTAHR